ncbi:retrotransposon protein, putative, ty1-copia subclass, partial [Tanacetum coccineum]
YDAYNEVACLILGSMTSELHRQFENSSPYDMIKELKSMFEKQAKVERFDLIQTFHACKQEEGKPVGAYVLKMKDYLKQLEHLGYVLPQDISVGLILNGLTSDFVSFYEKGLLKKATTPQVMMIQGGRIQKANKKSLNDKGKGKGKVKGNDKPVYISKPKNLKPSAKEHPTNDDACHYCKEVGHWKRNCPVYLAELIKKKNGKINSERTIKALQLDRGGEYISQEFKDYLKACGIVQQLTPPYTPQHNGVSERRNRTLLDMIQSKMNLITLSLSFWDYALETATRILNMVLTKKVDKTPYELWCGKVYNLSYLKVWGCEALVKRDTPGKLQQRSVKCIFVGYPKEIMCYYFYFPPENKIVVTRMNTSKRGYIPMQEKLDLNKTQGTSTLEEVKYMQNVPYASVVGSIMYATAVKTILKYLRNTKDMFLVYGGNPGAKLRVDCYCDVGFETDRDDTKSQTRYVFILNGGAIDWKSSKQILLQCPLQNLNT